MGTEAFWVPLALTALGTGAGYVNQKNADSRKDQGEAQAIRDQEQTQQEALGRANSLTKQIGANNPNQIAAKATGDYVSQLRKNAAGASQPGASSALAPAVGASSRYSTDVGNAQKSTADYGNNLAGEMGQIDAAVRQRQNEALAQQSLGTNLATLGAKSYTQNFVDQLRSQAAGVANPWAALGAGLLTNAGKNYTSAGPKTGMPAGTVLGDGTVGGAARTMPSVNPWFDTTGQT